MATRHSVRRLTAADLEALEAAIDEMETAMHEGDYRRLLELNRTFHSVIYRASGLQCLIDLISQLWEKSTRYRVAYIHLPDRARQAHEEHKEILRCLKSGAVARSARAVQNNIRQTMVGVIAAFDRHNRLLAPQEAGTKR
jgi:DNA-binding GntR family transcriptional regulator